MSSERQRKAGYPLPPDTTPTGSRSFCVTIPNDDAFQMAFYAQLVELGKWWMWKRDEARPTAATEAAMEWREKFTLTPDCGGTPMSCTDVEDCIEESVTIINMQTDISTNATNITNVTNTVNEQIEDCGCAKGNDYPPAQDNYNEKQANGVDSAMCGAAFYTADKLIAFLTDAYNKEASNQLQQFMALWLDATGGFDATELLNLWLWVVSLSDANFLTNLNAARSKIAAAFFCNKMDVSLAQAAIAADSSINANVRTALDKAILATFPVSFAIWRTIGQASQTGDCGAMCPAWTVVYEFKTGSYTPVGGETIITGDTWTKSNCLFSTSRGYYGSTANIWTITHNMPPDAQITTQYIQAARPPSGTSVQVGCWWKGATGTGALAIQPLVTVAAAPPAGTLVTFAEQNCELDALLGYMDNFGSGTPFDSEIHFIKIVGRGAKPNV